ncbi:MAG: sigma-54 interaction domain-containing protein [Negativicutes bacterium]
MVDEIEAGKVILQIVDRRPTDAVSPLFIQTQRGPIEFCWIQTDSFCGYIGVVCTDALRDAAVSALEEVNKELEAIFESSHDGIVVADENGIFIRINSSYERITGIPKDKILKLSAQKIVDKGLVSDSSTLHVLKTGKPFTFSQTFSSGRQSIITGSPVLNDENRLFRVVTNVRDMTEINSLKAELAESQEKLTQYSRIVESLTEEQMATESLIFRSRKMAMVRNSAVKFAKVDAPLLITGESGVGKEVIADLVYKNSLRKGAPFLKINCGAIPEALLESELFGYEGGAFTGAKREGRTGLFEMANGGTVMLDEIGELSMGLQVKLLRFVESKEFFRVGGNKVIKVDVRIIAATNRNLQDMVNQKHFRADLYYRLNVLTINIPALQERPEDIIPLTNHFLDKYNQKYQVSKRLTGELYRFFTGHKWVGNVRELEHLMERLIVVCDRDEITPDYLPEDMKCLLPDFNTEKVGTQSYREAKMIFEKDFFRRAIERHKSTRRAAENLGVDHSTIVKKAAKYGIELLSR